MSYNSGVAVVNCIQASDQYLNYWVNIESNAMTECLSPAFELLQKHARIEITLRVAGKARRIDRSEWGTLYIHTQKELVEFRHSGAWALWVKFENPESPKYMSFVKI